MMVIFMSQLFMIHSKENEYHYIREFSNKLIDKALELEGTITGEHGVGLQKKAYLIKEHPNSIPYMKLIKKTFDPNNIMNQERYLIL